MSEELENSLQQAVETYLNERLRAIGEQVARLQKDFDDAMSQVHDIARAQSLNGTALSAAIFAHLQTARGERLSAPPTVSIADAANLSRAVADIESRDSQTEILSTLMTRAAQYADRTAVFVIKSGQAKGWRLCNSIDVESTQSISNVSVPLSTETSLTKAVKSKQRWSGDARANPQDHLLLDQLGGDAKSAAVFPLIVRGKVVAVLYADSPSVDTSAINADAIEVLTRVTGLVVTVNAVQRAAPATTAPEAERSVAAEGQTPAAAAITTPEGAPQIESYTESAPQIAAPALQETTPTQASTEQVADRVSEPITTSLGVGQVGDNANASTANEVAEATTSQPPQNVTPTPPISSDPFASQYVAPLGSRRRFGISEPDLPIEVGEEERRLHNDARRFARLLISEIKLYNESKVAEGRNNGDLYDRLREDIDRSRQMYERRVAPPVAARHDYFHQELVNLLAEGDSSKLGQSYPGSSAAG